MGNFSRNTFNQLKNYVGVRLQQGVPIVDADWNEQEDIRKHELRTFLKWFVGNGVPKGNDGFRIVPLEGSENDFTIKGGDGTNEGAGRCLVEGWDVLIVNDVKYSEQSLPSGADPLGPLSPPLSGERTDTVYLDVWEREVDAQEDGKLVNPDIGIETCVRLKREWVVRVAEGITEQELPAPPKGHVYYPLASLKRTGNKNSIGQEDITDLRHTGLAVLSEEITIKDGNVGIGTTNPASMLTVGNYTLDSRLAVNTADVGVYVVTKNPEFPPSLAQSFASYLTKDVLEVGDRNQIRFLFKANNDNNSIGDLRFASSIEAIVENPNNSTKKSALRFMTSGTESGTETEKMRITSNGIVKIYTIAGGAWPAIEFHQGIHSSDENYYYRGKIYANPYGIFVDRDFTVGGGVTTSGKVGIGITDPDPAVRLVVGGALDPVIRMTSTDGSTGFIQTLHEHGGVRLYDGKDYTMHWKDGKVGIGTRNPRTALEIYSNVTGQGWYEAIILGPDDNSSIYHPGSRLMFNFLNSSSRRAFFFWDRAYEKAIMTLDAEEGGTLWVRSGRYTGGDYAEYFESRDGKEINAGISIALDNGKIRPAKKNETPIGVISANPGIVGGVHIEWPKKHLRDEFGRVIMEEFKEEIMKPKKEKIKKDRQKMEKKTVKEEVKRTEVVKIKGKYCQKEITETIEREIEEPVFEELDLYDAAGINKIGKHKIPLMETYEEEIDVLDDNGQPVMVGSGKYETKTRPKINPDYDETKEYIPREKRPEWNCVGLLGQLPLRKGQPVAPTWIKIKDISKDVELWLVK
jgi:hypothetical protein